MCTSKNELLLFPTEKSLWQNELLPLRKYSIPNEFYDQKQKGNPVIFTGVLPTDKVIIMPNSF